MAHKGHYNTAGSQFFILHGDADFLEQVRPLRPARPALPEVGRDRVGAHPPRGGRRPGSRPGVWGLVAGRGASPGPRRGAASGLHAIPAAP
jgi:cyclophilin family peptidyl-prolyl cis-trans isomerase